VSGRYGGEEFIIFAEVGEASSLEVLCERIRANVEKNTEKLCGIHFTISLGAAFSKIEGSEKETLTKLINDADNNLLKAKRSGKNRWII
jgi:diguanylate cyclase (GGDEF)-like protein